MCIYFSPSENRGVKLPPVTSIMYAWAAHMCEQRQDFACMMAANPGWSFLPGIRSKGPSSQWDRRSECQPTWQLDSDEKCTWHEVDIYVSADWAAYRNQREDFWSVESLSPEVDMATGPKISPFYRLLLFYKRAPTVLIFLSKLPQSQDGRLWCSPVSSYHRFVSIHWTTEPRKWAP